MSNHGVCKFKLDCSLFSVIYKLYHVYFKHLIIYTICNLTTYFLVPLVLLYLILIQYNLF